MPEHRSLVAQEVRNRTLEKKEFNNEMPQVAVIVKEAKREDEKEEAEMSAKRKKRAEVIQFIFLFYSSRGTPGDQDNPKLRILILT